MEATIDANGPDQIDIKGLSSIAERLGKQKAMAASEQLRSLISALERDNGSSPGTWANVDVFSVFSVFELARVLNPQG
ncbi:MAG: hypothetical protein NTZ50_16640, partial [Chloroflexi bacterium]|nr:hypothetical protein [Chloroflexota bacterium]